MGVYVLTRVGVTLLNLVILQVCVHVYTHLIRHAYPDTLLIAYMYATENSGGFEILLKST